MDAIRRAAALAMPLFVIVIAIVYAIQNLISPGLNTMSVYFGFGGETTQLGMLTASFTMSGGLAMLIFGYLADKVKRVRILVAGSFIHAVASVLVVLVAPDAAGFALFFTLQVIAGAGFGAMVPNTFSLIGDLISKEDRAKGYSFFSVATLVGTAVGQVLGATLIDVDWRLSYVFIGVAGLAGSACLLAIKEPSRAGRDIVLAGSGEVEYTYRIKLSDLKQVFTKKSNFWLIINFVDTIPTGIILFLLYKYLWDIHGVPEAMGLVFLALVLVSTLAGTAIFGFVGDALFKKGNKRARVYLALFANVAPIPFLAVALNIPFRLPIDGGLPELFALPAAVVMLVLMCAALFINGATNGCWYATVVDVNLPEHRGTVLATANFFDIIGRTMGPLIGALLTDAFDVLVGVNMSIIFWIAIPFFWIGVVKHVVRDMDAATRLIESRVASPASP